jgi:hypothetical protein
MRNFRKIFWSTLVVLVFIGLICYGLLFLALKLGWTNVNGSVDSNNLAYQEIDALPVEAAPVTDTAEIEKENKDNIASKISCKIEIITEKYPENGEAILKAYKTTQSVELAAKMIFVFNLKNTDAVLKNEIANCSRKTDQDLKMVAGSQSINQINPDIYAWTNTDEWPVIVDALTKEQSAINRAAQAAQIEPRLLVVPIVVEQLRLYFTQREYFQKFFKPFKILGVTTQMAMGVMSIKERTAIQIENYLKDQNSPYFPGEDYKHLLDFKTTHISEERFNRLTNSKDQYYSYLYGALFIKEVQTQWAKAGFQITNRPEILTTVYNLGFEHSDPKSNPKIGGSTLNIGGVSYTFGGLGAEFYYSGQMQDIFPFKP